MIDVICKANGKFPLEPEERREYYEPEDSIPHWNGDECGRLKAGFLKLDIDDRDHKTEQLIDPIHDQPRSDAVKAWLDSKKIRYNLMITEHGKHFYFKVPADFPHNKNVANWYCALAIKAEWKFGGGTSKEHIPYKVNGVNRIWATGDLFNENIDFIPKELWPLQKSKNKPFDLNMLNSG